MTTNLHCKIFGINVTCLKWKKQVIALYGMFYCLMVIRYYILESSNNCSPHSMNGQLQEEFPREKYEGKMPLDKVEPNPFFKKYQFQSCKKCTLPKRTFLIKNTERCEPPKIDLVILINSYHANVHHRTAIRNTYGEPEVMERLKITYVFLLGVNKDEKLNAQIEKESKIYGDIVQGDIEERYPNLALKTIMGFEWTTKYCRNARYVLKTDDDMFLNVQLIKQSILQGTLVDKDTIKGACMGSGYVHRCPRSKWYASYRSYPHQYYEDFCLGAALFMTRDTVKQLYKASKTTPYFHVEDVFITSLVPKKLKFQKQNMGGLDRSVDTVIHKCPLESGIYASLLSGPSQMYDIYRSQQRYISKHNCTVY